MATNSTTTVTEKYKDDNCNRKQTAFYIVDA